MLVERKQTSRNNASEVAQAIVSRQIGDSGGGTGKLNRTSEIHDVRTTEAQFHGINAGIGVIDQTKITTSDRPRFPIEIPQRYRCRKRGGQTLVANEKQGA